MTQSSLNQSGKASKNWLLLAELQKSQEITELRQKTWAKWIFIAKNIKKLFFTFEAITIAGIAPAPKAIIHLNPSSNPQTGDKKVTAIELKSAINEAIEALLMEIDDLNLESAKMNKKPRKICAANIVFVVNQVFSENSLIPFDKLSQDRGLNIERSSIFDFKTPSPSSPSSVAKRLQYFQK